MCVRAQVKARTALALLTLIRARAVGAQATHALESVIGCLHLGPARVMRSKDTQRVMEALADWELDEPARAAVRRLLCQVPIALLPESRTVLGVDAISLRRCRGWNSRRRACRNWCVHRYWHGRGVDTKCASWFGLSGRGADRGEGGVAIGRRNTLGQ